MAEVKGNIDVVNIDISRKGYLKGKELFSEVNGETSKTGSLNLTNIGTLKFIKDLNEQQSYGNFYYGNETSEGSYTTDIHNFVGFKLISAKVSSDFIVTNDKVLFRTKDSVWNDWQGLATEKWVSDYVTDNVGNIFDPLLYYTKDYIDDTFLPIVSNKHPTMGTPTIFTNNDYPGIMFRGVDDSKIGIEATKAERLTIWANNSAGERKYAVYFPTETGTVATREWVSKMIYNSDPTTTVVRNPQSPISIGLLVKDNGDVGVWDFSQNKWYLHHNKSFLTTYGGIKVQSSGDYPYLILEKKNKKYLALETNPDANEDVIGFGNIIYREANGDNISVLSMPVEVGMLATREWVSNNVSGSDVTKAWVNTMIIGNDVTTIMRSPDGTCWWGANNNLLYAKNGESQKHLFELTKQGQATFFNGVNITYSSDYISTKWIRQDNTSILLQTTPYNNNQSQQTAFAFYEQDKLEGATNVNTWRFAREGSTVVATREWVNSFIRTNNLGLSINKSGANDELAVNNDGNIGTWSISGKRWWWVSNKSKFDLQGLDNSNTNRPSYQLSSPTDKWRMEPDSAGKLQFVHEQTGTIYEVEKSGGTNQIATKQWVENTNHENYILTTYNNQWLNIRDQFGVIKNSSAVSNGSASAIIRQEHDTKHFMVAGLGNATEAQFGFYMINKDRLNNGTDAAAFLQQNGTWRCNGNGSFNDVEIRSDIRKKSNLVLIASATSKLLTLSGYTYDVTDDNGNVSSSAGLIAQDVKEVLPEIVKTDSNGFLNMSYNGINALLVESIKELHKRIEDLEKKLNG